MSEGDVLVRIEEIRHQLWLGHASAMIGSGLTLNADKATPNTHIPPTWKDLAVALANRLYSVYGDKVINENLLSKNVLQLAQEFERAFQRKELNNLLKELIQDDELLPNKLHVDMLELPWNDIFTTNYDTLLERASKRVFKKKYDIVLDCKDLPYSEQPRIIKLHGSFPSEATHLIVTEEDYRTYPDIYTPFVNTVQQSMMESTLCMFGFSGTDPNFLRWIGWVKDHLKDSMPPVYLIGLLNLMDTEKKVLESKNIIPVDLAELKDVARGDYKTAFRKLLTKLQESPHYVDWHPDCSPEALFPPKKDEKEKIENIIKNWKKERESYPNWIIVPWHIRTSFVQIMQIWSKSLDYLKGLSSPWDLLGLYEFNWRMEKCLMPIWNHLIDDYEEIVNRYDPYKIFEDSGKINRDEQFKSQWMSLCLSLLRWSREEADEKKWNHYSEIISKISDNNIACINNHIYEQIMFSLAKPDLSRIDALCGQWEKLEHPVNWKLKHASILAILGQPDKAISYLIEALNEVRPYIPKSKIKNDYYLLNVEGNILASLCLAEQYMKFFVKGEERKDDENKEEKYKSRLRELEQYYCNPWSELDRFELSLSAPEKIDKEESIHRKFDGTITTLTFYNGWMHKKSGESNISKSR